MRLLCRNQACAQLPYRILATQLLLPCGQLQGSNASRRASLWAAAVYRNSALTLDGGIEDILRYPRLRSIVISRDIM